MADRPDSFPIAYQCRRNSQLLEEILRQDEHRLRRQAERHAQLPSDAEDALQTAYLRFIERYAGIGEPLAWLYATVKREAWAIRGRRSRQQRSFRMVSGEGEADFDLAEALPSDCPGPAEQVERQEALNDRRSAIASLKRDERTALWLPGLGLSYAEICETMGWTYTKVNRCISEGRSSLRRAGAL
jgi:RNA polymerase sigma factor (sigma-70 family)